MIPVDVLCYVVLAGALVAVEPKPGRRSAGRAEANAYMSNGRGSVGLAFRTVAPNAIADAVTGTVHTERKSEGWVVHRIVMDTARGLYYGYDVELSWAPGTEQYVAAIKPLAPAVDEDFRLREWRDFCRDCPAPRAITSPSQRFPEPHLVSRGDVLTFELMADERTGEPITEEVTLGDGEGLLSRRSRSRPPRDLEARYVALQMVDPHIRVNGGVAVRPGGEHDAGGAMQGTVLWVELPGHGRVFLSLAPRPGYDFQRIGVVSGDRITFSIDGDRYELICDDPIATSVPARFRDSVQSWYIWVLHDADYDPLDRRGGVGAGFDERAENRLKRPGGT